MNKKELQIEIIKLMDKRTDLNKLLEKRDSKTFHVRYQLWYNDCIIILKQLMPERLDDFKSLYNTKNINKPEPNQFYIEDYIVGNLIYSNGNFSDGPLREATTMSKLNVQFTIVASLLVAIESKISNIYSELITNIFEEEIECAEHLLNKNYLRSAGAVCGVILEMQMNNIIKNRGLSIAESNSTLSVYNDFLKKNGVYDNVEWSNICSLITIRNYCDHKKEREPTKEEVQRLIKGTKEFIERDY